MPAMTDALAQIRGLEKLAEAAANDPKAHRELRNGISKLQSTLETPRETISRLNFQPLQNICIRIAVEKGWLQTIAQRGSATAADVAAATGTEQSFLIRPMRVLTAIGLCDEIGSQTYEANERTHLKIQEGSIGAEKHHFDLDFPMGARMVDYMRGPGISEFADDPDRMTIFEYTHKSRTIFQLLEENMEQKKSFDDYMKAWRLPNMTPWFEVFPVKSKFADARKNSHAILLVDIAGGLGHEGESFRQRNPDIPGQCYLQELPLTLNRLEKEPEGIKTMEHDFFNPQPLKGARAYFFRHILHNWSDADSKKILSHIVEAMEPDYSTLLINEKVLADIGVPLEQGQMDILMWLHTSGKERTEREWKVLCEGVGLEIVKIWSAENVGESVIETRKLQPRDDVKGSD